MRLDQYSNPIFNSIDLFNLLYQSKTDIISSLIVDPCEDIFLLEQVSGLTFDKSTSTDYTVQEIDKVSQTNWFMPDKYKTFDILNYLHSKCTTPEQFARVDEEYEEFKKRSMIDLLRWLKYFVDFCDENNILYGVGRGSSVASYILFLLNVHHIDSLKYNLEWQEFLR